MLDASQVLMKNHHASFDTFGPFSERYCIALRAFAKT